MNSKKLSKKLDRATDKIRKYQTMSSAVDTLKGLGQESLTLKEVITTAVAGQSDCSKTCISVGFSRDEGYGTLGKWKVTVGSKDFLGKSLNSALRHCLRHYKEDYQKSVASFVA